MNKIVKLKYPFKLGEVLLEKGTELEIMYIEELQEISDWKNMKYSETSTMVVVKHPETKRPLFLSLSQIVMV